MSKLLGAGMKVWEGASDSAFDKKDLEGLRGLLETGSGLVGLRKAKAPETAALHLALVTRSFGRALGRHQELHGLSAPLASAWQRWRSKEETARKEEIELRMKLAAPKLIELGAGSDKELEFVGSLHAPLSSPYYRALWWAFTDAKLTIAEQGEVPPFDLTATAAREFERFFLLEYLRGLAGAPAIADYLEGMERYRELLVRDLLLRELATWGGRHVFGNVRREEWEKQGDGVLPFLALDDQYVEPLAWVAERGEGRREEVQKDGKPILALLRELLAASGGPKVIVVTADFGSGKSLSARKLACDLAREFLGSAQRAPELWRPAYVRCAEDFSSERVDLGDTLRRALKRTAEHPGHSAGVDDPAFAWPEREQRFLCLLDGLDEVVLGQAELSTLFQKLGDKTTERHRFVVFTRPGVLPQELGKHVQEVRLLPFEDPQIDEWLAKWWQGTQAQAESAPLTREQIRQRGLAELAPTPILLFMIAFTWAKHSRDEGEISEALLYEQFFRQLANGKAEGDREQHRPIREASQKLLVVLRQSRELDDKATATEAMLWLMGRVAWQAVRLEQTKQRALRKSDVEHLLEAELTPAPPEQVVELIQLGLVLALQANLRSGNTTILFGHQSFREFMVARYWSQELLRIVRGNEAEWHKTPARLLGARLLGIGDRSFEFLMQVVNQGGPPIAAGAWTDEDRGKLVRWAEHTFNDESLQKLGGPSAVPAPTLREDERLYLREAALAIGSYTAGSSGVTARDPQRLMSMLCSFFLHGLPAAVMSPGGTHPKAQLAGAILVSADLEEANFQEANLRLAHLRSANLQKTNLQRADLLQANLTHANLQEANLQEANLQGAFLQGARLRFADLRRTRLQRCSLQEAYLNNAQLEGSNLHEARLEGAHLAEAQLTEAVLQQTNLQRANLRQANLQRAVLRYADLRGANLKWADLRGAKLEGAKLMTPPEEYRPDRDPLAAHFDETTRWPEGFEPPVIPPEQLYDINDDPVYNAEDFSGYDYDD